MERWPAYRLPRYMHAAETARTFDMGLLPYQLETILFCGGEKWRHREVKSPSNTQLVLMLRSNLLGKCLNLGGAV